MRAWQTNSQLRPIEISVDKIVIGNFPYFNCFKQDLRIIVDNEYVLISGLAQLEAQKSSGKAKALVIILDVEALLLEMRTLAHMNAHFLISEEIAITRRLKQLLGNRQGKHSDLGKTSKREKKNNPPNSALSLMLDEVRGRTDEHIARILGVGKDTYHSAEKACLHGIPELIDALDRQELSIAKAAKISKLPKDQQLTFIQQEKKGARIW